MNFACRHQPTLVLLGFLLSFTFSVTANTSQETEQVLQSIIHNLDYVSVDYPGIVNNGRIENQDEFTEQLEIATHTIQLLNSLPDSPQKAALIQRGDKLLTALNSIATPTTIVSICQDTIATLTASYNVKNKPSLLPSLDEGRQLFNENCVSCHGADGRGDGKLAIGMSPSPANFHDRDRQRFRNIFSLYNVISLGANGTAMPAFTQLKSEQRWSLAFYISNFFATDDEIKQGEKLWNSGKFQNQLGTLQQVTQAKPDEISKQYGEDALYVLAYLRSNPQELSESTPNPLATSRLALNNSLNAFKLGDSEQAYNFALTAYVNGFEKVEARLRVIDPDLRINIERKMLGYRTAIRNNPGLIQLETDHSHLLAMLDQADTALAGPTVSPWVNFFSSMVILLREGLEAILVLAAIITVLKKSGRRDAIRFIHMGWASALVTGVATWFIASHFINISGAQREFTEGVTALIAAGMLLYIGIWLHDQSQAIKWQQYVHSKLSTSLSGGTIWGLVFIAFIAVYREIFESILFYQSLILNIEATQHRYIFAGILIAIIALLFLAILINHYSVRLPLKKFFSLNMWLMFILAIIFAGKGIAALQEANTLPTNPVNFPQIDLLGIYPNLESLGLQLTLICLALAWHSLRYIRREKR